MAQGAISAKRTPSSLKPNQAGSDRASAQVAGSNLQQQVAGLLKRGFRLKTVNLPQEAAAQHPAGEP